MGGGGGGLSDYWLFPGKNAFDMEPKVAEMIPAPWSPRNTEITASWRLVKLNYENN